MKTKSAKKSTQRKSDQTISNTIEFYVLASSMNDDDKQQMDAEENESGYPDFYEDTDNMNRYLW